jgi:hypothetical protein
VIGQAGLELSTCLSLLNAGITRVSHNAWLVKGDFNGTYLIDVLGGSLSLYLKSTSHSTRCTPRVLPRFAFASIIILGLLENLKMGQICPRKDLAVKRSLTWKLGHLGLNLVTIYSSSMSPQFL